MEQADVIIIGSGIAALQLIGNLRRDVNVIILTKSEIKTGNSFLAQGGVAASVGAEDDPYDHYRDTLEAGRGINDHEAVIQLTKQAPSVIGDLLEAGCDFDRNYRGELRLGREGSHSCNRIVHGGGDQTGKWIINCLLQKIGPNVRVKEHEFVYQLLTDEQGSCYGVKSKHRGGTKKTYLAPHVVLATGGCGRVYDATSNAETVTGDGLALGYLAGAELVDMEFVQFHPTLLSINGDIKGLVSEAVRGEGAFLVDEEGMPVMKGVHPLEDLAPRHIVAQTIYNHIQQGREVFLDITCIDNFTRKFPTVTRLCEKHGIAVEEGKIPVAPGCHFLMGGIRTDDVGGTTVKGLYAIGEVACTGVHGANRLASNSLLEGLVYGKRLAQHINHHSKEVISFQAPRPMEENREVILPSMEEIQQSMMKRVGIIRNKNELILQQEWLDSFSLPENMDTLTIGQISRVFMVITSKLITTSALEREESRGGHFRQDFPLERSDWQHRHVRLHKNRKQGEIYESINAPAFT
ncbi:L-aspartate oxidase [Thalassobacillus cyri]|uniref:L-aspartate oxidase n=1 Tax=Thalassobacillus cyri TaxID=571932 RepID=A0A1H4EF14_9BACI|nr:L-aspartate oxidase [Thalassobacillus cyri]SEA83407.1 L-aspartate oxidase [Thalassobacillus cyri]